MTTGQPVQSKSQRTRTLIFGSARRLFAAHGYDGASVRDIAAEAGIDPALVIRYFGSKDALFAEVSEFTLALPEVDSSMLPFAGRFLVRNFLDIWEGPDAGGGFTVLLRSAASNEGAADKLREVFAGQIVPSVAAIAGPAAAPERAGLITSHMLGLALCRYILKLPPVVLLSQATIVEQAGDAVQQYLNAPAEQF